MNKKSRIEEIQVVRSFAVLGVLFVHGSSTGVTSIPINSTVFPLYNFFNIFGKFGTATFILLSSFVLFFNYYDKVVDKKMLGRFYLRRILYVLIPYFVFSLIYYFNRTYHYTGFEDYIFLLKDFLLRLFTGKAHPHLYFVFVSVQFYIMFPIFLVLFKKIEFIRKNALIIGFSLQWIWVLMNYKYIGFSLKGSVALSYMLYYFSGAFLGIYYYEILDWFKEWKKNIKYIVGLIVLYISSIVFYVSIFYNIRTKGSKYSTLIIEFAWSTHAILGATFMILFGHLVYKYVNPKIKKFFISLSMVSFGIYLIHPLLLFYLRRNLPSGEPIIFHSYQFFSFLVSLFGSWFIVWLTFKYIPYSWILFGKKEN